jgi:hypothetical protein
MTRKQILFRATGALLLVGVVFAMVPFISALKPSARAYAELPRFEIPDLEPSSFIFVDYPLAAKPWDADILVVSRESGHRDYWYIPTWNGERTLPDYYWWRPGVACNDLRPNFTKGEIYCHDPDMSSYQRWSLDGIDLTESGWSPNLERVRGKEDLGDFILFHPDGRE